MSHLPAFRKQFKLNPKADLRTVQIAVEAIYESQRIGCAYLSEVGNPSAKDAFRIQSFLNLMSRTYEHTQAMLVALATGSPASCEALGRIVVEGSINLMYLATLGDASTLASFFDSWIKEHEKKLTEWDKRLQGTSYAETVGKMIAERKEVIGGYVQYMDIVKSQCGIADAQGSYLWPASMLKRFEALGRTTDYYESYHRLSGSTHSTGEDTLTFLMVMLTNDKNLMHKTAVEAWAYSTMMSRLVCTFYVDAVAACVLAYGRTENEDLQLLRHKLAKAVHEVSKAAGVPQSQ